MAEIIGTKQFLKYCQYIKKSVFVQSAVRSVMFLWTLWQALNSPRSPFLFLPTSGGVPLPLTPPSQPSWPISSSSANSEANYTVIAGTKPNLSVLCLLITATCLTRSFFFPQTLYLSKIFLLLFQFSFQSWTYLSF